MAQVIRREQLNLRAGQRVKDKEFNHPSTVVKVTETHLYVRDFFLVRYTWEEVRKYIRGIK
jgi:hypothetical protein